MAESDSDYGVIFVCTLADEKYMLRTFLTAIKGFRLLEPDEDEETDDEDGPAASDDGIFVDSETKPDVWRAARKKRLISGWEARDTENYLIVYNKDVKSRLLRNIAVQIEAIRRDVYEVVFPPVKEVKAISVVRVCKDREEYMRYGGAGGTAGYWNPRDEELVFFQDRSNKKDSLRVLYHEAFHQYIHYAIGEVAPHSWFNEGHGDYFAGHNYRSGKFNADVFRWRTGTIATALSRKEYVPLAQFLKMSQSEYYARPGLCYAQGWSFVYFLREVERRKIKKYKQYWGLLDEYFAAIKANVSAVKERAFEGLPGTPGIPDPVPGSNAAGDEPRDDESQPLSRLPGLGEPFPGEQPVSGAAPGDANTDGRRTVSGPVLTDTTSALDAAVDQVFLKNRKIDIEQLEKDWIEFSK